MTFFNRKNKETTPKLTRDEKLQIECDELNKRDEQYIDSLCYIKELFIFRGYSVTYYSYRCRNEICVDRKDATCIEGFLKSTPLDVFKDRYKTSIKDARYNYLKLKNDLNKLGRDIVKI